MLGNDCLHFFTFQDLTYLIHVPMVQWWLPPLEMGSFSLVAIRIVKPFTKWHRTPMEPSSGQKWNKNSNIQDLINLLLLQSQMTRLIVNNLKYFYSCLSTQIKVLKIQSESRKLSFSYSLCQRLLYFFFWVHIRYLQSFIEKVSLRCYCISIWCLRSINWMKRFW